MKGKSMSERLHDAYRWLVGKEVRTKIAAVNTLSKPDEFEQLEARHKVLDRRLSEIHDQQGANRVAS